MARSRRRFDKKINIRPKHIFIALAVLCSVLMIVSYLFPERFAPVRSGVKTVITPMQSGVNNLGSAIRAKFNILSNLSGLIEENERLNAELAELKKTNSILIQDKYELDELRKLYELDKTYVDYPKVAARIIASDTSNWYSTFTIDKGANDGIKVDMNVMADGGLVGIVTSVQSNCATVRSIIDDDSSLSGMFLSTSDTCIVSGDLKLINEGMINVSMISLKADIKEGYEVVTSYISTKYLPGILIGYVNDIQIDSGNMTKKAYLTPIVDFRHLQDVLVITELKEAYEMETD